MTDLEINESVLRKDRPRLTGTLNRCLALMQDGRRRTLNEIASVLDCSTQGAGARLRELRCPKNGGWTVNKNQVSVGLWEYWVTSPNQCKNTPNKQCSQGELFAIPQPNYYDEENLR